MRQTIAKTIASFLICSVLFSCRETLSGPSDTGFLEIPAIEISTASRQVLTRAVDPGLNIEVLSAEGVCLKSFPAGTAEVSSKIELVPGEYSLRAYSPSLGLVAEEGEKGEPIYEAVRPFTVSSGKTTRLDVRVPMVNFGISLSLPEGFAESFASYRFTVSAGGRNVSLMDGETAYFAPPSDGSFPVCTLSAVNRDGEQYSSTFSHNAGVEAGTVYVLTYLFQTRSISFQLPASQTPASED